MKKTKILIVEDEPLIAEDIADHCLSFGYDVVGPALSAAEALQCIADTPPDLILLDINLEDEIDGIELATHLNKRKHIPFIYLTSYSDQATIQKAKVTGPINFIVKPFNKEQLRTTIELSLHNLQKDILPGRIDIDQLNGQLMQPITSREKEILQLVIDGKSNQEIATLLFLSINTVKYHFKQIFKKFDVSSRFALLSKLQELTK